MDEREWLAERFEEHRSHLRSVAYRMLGSVSEADDAVQDTWLRLSRADTGNVANMGAWLTTVVARVCLNTAPGSRLPTPTSPANVTSSTRSSPPRVTGGKIASIEVLSDPERLHQLDLTALDALDD